MNTRQFSPLTSTTMKREREEVAMESANCLMLISRVGEEPKRSSSKERMYKCKTCNREFPTFQALGGHRASHKKPRLEMSGLEMFGLEMSNLLAKHKMHECSICGLEFPIGQALGGHMRRHRAEMVSEKRAVTQQQFPDGGGGGGGGVLVKKKPTILISHNNNNNGMVCLDLNLSPFENDLSLKLGLMACAVDLA